ncbi:hypothetical protein [Clostridium gasigenes]|uniref:DUF5050 domain-containing protein n=1 Tax=Clostridium gasigenes TaxID=94869 RepID=A0A7X0VQX5_9CLOT|nr:hypothetical protein [Clostridium gasigenes]MBB6714827.1 hypothetical protein [Clostridium gasigenes]
MSTKDFKKGMEAGAKPFNEKFNEISNATKKIGEQINTKISSLDEVIDVIIDDISSINKKKIYDLNTKIDIKECLDNEEKELLAAILISISNVDTVNNNYQQKFIRSVNSYIGITEPQVSVDLSKIENVENISSQKAILQVIMEYLFLGYGNFDFEVNYEENLLDYFNVNKKGMRDIKECIQAVYNATGFEGISEKYGYVFKEQLDTEDQIDYVKKCFKTYDGSDISENCADKVNINDYVVLDDYLVYKDDTELFKVDKLNGNREKINIKLIGINTILGGGKYLCIRSNFDVDVTIIDIETLIETNISEIDKFSGCSCNRGNFFYTKEVDNVKRMCMYNYESGTTRILEYIKDSENILTIGKFYIKDDYIYLTSCDTIFSNDNYKLDRNMLYKYIISTGKLETLCEIPSSVSWDFLDSDDTNIYNNYLYTKSSMNQVGSYSYVDLDNPKAVRCNLNIVNDYSDIDLFVGYGVIYYVVLNHKFPICKYDIDTGKSDVVSENTDCGFSGETKVGLFKKKTVYQVGYKKPQVVGRWLYYRPLLDKKILKISTDAIMGTAELVDLQ